LAQILIQDVVDHVSDVGAEVDQGTCEVDPFANASQAGSRDIMSLSAEDSANVAEAVRTTPGTVNQH
jgi:hypothetical protein